MWWNRFGHQVGLTGALPLAYRVRCLWPIGQSGCVCYCKQVFLKKFRHGDRVMQNLLDGYMGRMCKDLQISAVSSQADILLRLKKLSERKGPQGESMRWMSAYDASDFNTKYRHCRMFLIDLALMTENGCPYLVRNIDCMDTLDDVFRKEGNSLAAACHVLRDDRCWQAEVWSILDVSLLSTSTFDLHSASTFNIYILHTLSTATFDIYI